MTPDRTLTPDRDHWGDEQSRTVTWHDPGPTTRQGLQMAGADYLQAVVEGRMPPPPIANVLLSQLVSVEPGRVVFTCTPDQSTYNPIGTVHGGLVCTLLDSAAGCAIHSVLPAGRGYTSVEIKVNYLKAVRQETGTLTAVGTVVKTGARVGFTEATVTDESGALVATASSTLLIFEL